MANDSFISNSNVYARTATDIKEKPTKNSKTILVVGKNEYLGYTAGNYISGQDGEWLLLKTKNNLYGWIKRDEAHPYYVSNFMQLIAWDTIPEINENWFENLTFLRGSAWKSNQFMTWHKALLQKFGKEKANNLFLNYWQKQGNFSPAIDARTFDNNFREYAKKNSFYNGLYNNNIVENTLKTVTDVKDVAIDLTNKVVNEIDETIQDKDKTFNIIKIAAFGALALVVYNAIKTIKQ